MVIIAVRIRIQTKVITDPGIYVPDTAKTWPQRSTADVFAPILANFPFRFGLSNRSSLIFSMLEPIHLQCYSFL